LRSRANGPRNPEGESYDLDHFGMIVSTKDEGSELQ
jgi:hypothetical protein